MEPVIWLTGLSGSGKSTLVKNIISKLDNKCIEIDGDVLRNSTSNFNFTNSGRFSNVQKAIEICEENPDNIVIVSLISPLREMRNLAKLSLGDRFIEVYVQCSLSECIKRDVKGLYKKALNNEINHFTGISHPYEEPYSPDIVVNTQFFDLEYCVDKIISVVLNKERGE